MVDKSILLDNKRLSVKTGKWTGRCPHAKKYVKCKEDVSTEDRVSMLRLIENMTL
mgnify:CR=1 FL=1